jgi:phosphoribosylformylglycinamidine synthase
MRAAVVVFPGTNCDRDTKAACGEFGWDADYVWHSAQSLSGYDVVFLPGGFSYGDYVGAGRLAKFSPVVDAVKEYVKSGRGVVVGVCNGFQILCEAGLLPGALLHNSGMRFVCKDSRLKINGGAAITLPIAHGEGCYFADGDVISELKRREMIFLTYADNPNGSVADIAGLFDRERNIIGMMPHPERAFFAATGSTDGREIFRIIEQALAVKR